MAPERVKGLTGLDLVSEALYWRGSALLHLRRFAEGKTLADAVLADFADSRAAKRAANLKRMCADALGEVK